VQRDALEYLATHGKNERKKEKKKEKRKKTDVFEIAINNVLV